MGYNLRVYVVDPYHYHEVPQTGRVLVMTELESIDSNGELYKLIEKSQNPKIPFAIRVEKPDSGHALMSWVTDYIACGELPEDEKKTLTEWNLDYEESLITTDRYGDKLAVCDLDEFLEALKKEGYSNFGLKLTKIILEEIQSTAPHNGCFLKIVTYGH